MLTQDAPFHATLLVNQTAVHGIPAGINRLTETLLSTLGAPEPHVRLVSQAMDAVPGEQSVKIQEAAGKPACLLALSEKAACARGEPEVDAVPGEQSVKSQEAAGVPPCCEEAVLGSFCSTAMAGPCWPAAACLSPDRQLDNAAESPRCCANGPIMVLCTPAAEKHPQHLKLQACTESLKRAQKHTLRCAGGFIVVLCTVIAVAVLSSSFIVQLVAERACGSKHLQRLAGTYGATFWGATLVCDLAAFALSAAGAP